MLKIVEIGENVDRWHVFTTGGFVQRSCNRYRFGLSIVNTT
jgi:hypothetical protein